jgi:Zn-dependent protease with chaperone function
MQPTPILQFQQAARGSPIAWAGLIAMLGSVYLVARLVTWSGIAVALRPWRRSQGSSWIERARADWPGRRLGRLAPVFIMLPMTFAVARDGRRIDLLPAVATNLLVAAAALLGALQASIAWGRRVNPSWTCTPRPGRGAWILSLSWVAPLAALVAILFSLSGPAWDARAWALLAVGTIAVGTYTGWGWLRVMRWTGVIRPADDRFRGIAVRAAERAGIRLRSVEQVALAMANAFAFVHDRGIAVSDTALAVLDDDELGAVCAHEMAHLGEPGWVRAIRLSFGFLLGLYLSACCLIRPMIGSLPLSVVWLFILGAPLVFLLARSLFLRLAHRMEIRADAQAGPAEETPGAYARALVKMYEMNLVPVVLGMKRQTHPELYDRLVALGAGPEYPWPSAPPRGPWRAGFLALVLGTIAGWYFVTDVVARRLPRAVFGPGFAALWTTGAVGGTLEEILATYVDVEDRDDMKAE